MNNRLKQTVQANRKEQKSGEHLSVKVLQGGIIFNEGKMKRITICVRPVLLHKAE